MNEQTKTNETPIAGYLAVSSQVFSPAEIVEKAKELIQPIKFEPHDTAYFVTQNDRDMGNEDYCENCIDNAVKEARKYYKENRQSILSKFKEIEETGFFKGQNIKEKYSVAEIKKAKRYELKDYPSKSKFGYENHDPDFSGGEKSARTCEGCGEYFYTDFEPDLEECNYLLEEYGDGSNVSESLKWKLEIAFYNWEYLDDDAKSVLLSIAEKIVGAVLNT